MHELGITQRLLNVALEQAQLEVGERIQRLHITLDPNSGYVPDSIRFYFDQVARNSAAANAELLFEWSESGQPIRLTRVEIEEIVAAAGDHAQFPANEATAEIVHWQIIWTNSEPSADYLTFINALLADLKLEGQLHTGAQEIVLELQGLAHQLAHFCHHLQHDAPPGSPVNFAVNERGL